LQPFRNVTDCAKQECHSGIENGIARTRLSAQ
jgi:hypothetical protein